MLATLLGSGTRACVLVLLLARPRRAYQLRELIRLAGCGASGVQREIARLEGRATRFFELRRELERASGLPVDLVEEEAVTNPYLREEIARTGVVILEAA